MLRLPECASQYWLVMMVTALTLTDQLVSAVPPGGTARMAWAGGMSGPTSKSPFATSATADDAANISDAHNTAAVTMRRRSVFTMGSRGWGVRGGASVTTGATAGSIGQRRGRRRPVFSPRR